MIAFNQSFPSRQQRSTGASGSVHIIIKKKDPDVHMWGSVSLLVATDTIYMNKGIDPGLRLQSPLLYPVFCHELSLHLKYRRLEVR